MEFFHVPDAWVQEEAVPHTFEDTQWSLRARGAPEALDFAGYVVAFLIRHWRFCWDYRRGRARAAARDDFMGGLYGGCGACWPGSGARPARRRRSPC
jgi:hypothetical protein